MCWGGGDMEESAARLAQSHSPFALIFLFLGSIILGQFLTYLDESCYVLMLNVMLGFVWPAKRP